MYYSDNEIDEDGNERAKIFVGGTSQDTNSDHLREYFSQFGEIEDSTVMMDNRTGHSRGFGYVKFKNDSSVVYAIEKGVHYILNKYVDVRRSNVNLKGRNRRNLRIFVGGVSLDQTEDSLRNYFSQFGKVTDVNLMIDKTRNHHRGFAFVGFENESIVSNLIKMHYVQIEGKIVEIKALEPPKYSRKNSVQLACQVPVSGSSSSFVSSDNQQPVKCYTTQVLQNSVNSSPYRLVGYTPIIPGSPYYSPVYETTGFVYYSPELNYDNATVGASKIPDNLISNTVQTSQPMVQQISPQPQIISGDHSFPASASGDNSLVLRAPIQPDAGLWRIPVSLYSQDQQKHVENSNDASQGYSHQTMGSVQK